jgi:hypothetical protein
MSCLRPRPGGTSTASFPQEYVRLPKKGLVDFLAPQRDIVLAKFYPARKIHEYVFDVKIARNTDQLNHYAKTLEGLGPFHTVTRGGRTFAAYYAFEEATVGQYPPGICAMVFHEWLLAVAFCTHAQ